MGEHTQDLTAPGEPVAKDWRRPVQCGAEGSCVEIAIDGDLVFVRSSLAIGQPPTQFTPREWHDFIASVKSGEYDRVMADNRVTGEISPA